MATSLDTPVRGDETRTLLIDAGLKLFSRLGFEAVSTRFVTRNHSGLTTPSGWTLFDGDILTARAF